MVEADGSKLPETYSRYFELRLEGYKPDEIAAELGIPEDALETFIALAHAKLSSRATRSCSVDEDRPS